MWTQLAHIIIKYRLFFLILLGLTTIFMGYQSQYLQMSYTFSKVVPKSDPDMQYYQKFKSRFGEDGNVMAIGMQDSSLYNRKTFKKYTELTFRIDSLKGINKVLGIPNIRKLKKNREEGRFELSAPLFKPFPQKQETFDSLLALANDLKLYSNQLINPENGATMMLITIKPEYLRSEKRDPLINKIKDWGQAFSKDTGIELHYAGLPYLRSNLTSKVGEELKLLLILALGVTAFILLLFFRSFSAVIFTISVIGIAVIWTTGTIVLLGYHITILTALLPPIIVVIGIPNCIYMLNKYHQEYKRHGSKGRSLSVIIRKIGVVAIITNFTTAIGFLVLAFTQVTILKEFGIVAALNIMATFIISIILIPSVFTYLPEPNNKQLKHLEFTPLNKVINVLDYLVHKKRIGIYIATLLVIGISLYGAFNIKAVSYMADDIPEDGVYQADLEFFERNFGGVMPLEIGINTGTKKGVRSLSRLRKINEVQEFIAKQPVVSNPLSLIEFVKASSQAFYQDKPEFYRIPNNRDKLFIDRYMKGFGDTLGLMDRYVDTSGQYMRISFRIADIGSTKMDSLLNQVIRPKIKEEFEGTKLTAKITGTTPLFMKGHRYLIQNLKYSLLIAIGVIAIVMAALFRSVKMILISLVPNMIPLLITAGIMGFFGIALKPGTAMIFSIAFGISVDDSIHFLARYRQALFANHFNVSRAITVSLRETGTSMIYTSIVLFAGFIIFVTSDFGSTVALGILTSATLSFAMLTNLVVLPALLLTFDTGYRRRDTQPLIEEYYKDSENGSDGLDQKGIHTNGSTRKEESIDREV